MVGSKIPDGPHQATAQWLTDALREGGAIAALRIVDVATEEVVGGTSYLGRVGRLRPRYDGNDEDAPRTLIAKFPAPMEENRAIGRAFRFYEREVRFYERISAGVPIRVPRLYYADLSEDGTRFVMLLEDLLPAQIGDQMVGWAIGQADLAIRHVARFHAHFWNSAAVHNLEWLPRWNSAFLVELVDSAFRASWSPFLENYGTGLSPAARALGERLREGVEPLATYLAAEPWTLAHGDFRLDNLFFGTSSYEDGFAVIDWQIVAAGKGLFDVAYLLVQSGPTAKRRRAEADLLRSYYDALGRSGVDGYSWDDCRADYRAAVLYTMIYAVIAGGSLRPSDDTARKTLDVVVARTIAAIDDHADPALMTRIGLD